MENNSEIKGPIPFWAAKRSSGNYMEVGAQLPTRDGRLTGNAVVVELSHICIDEQSNTVLHTAIVITDAGNKLELTKGELCSMFYPPEFVMGKDHFNKKGIIRDQG